MCAWIAASSPRRGGEARDRAARFLERDVDSAAKQLLDELLSGVEVVIETPRAGAADLLGDLRERRGRVAAPREDLRRRVEDLLALQGPAGEARCGASLRRAHRVAYLRVAPRWRPICFIKPSRS
jgi:plasmid stabilization system protein ParE